MPEARVFMIQGLFFQDMPQLDVVHEHADGARVVINDYTHRHMFAGSIFIDPSTDDDYQGSLYDYFGYAVLSDIKFDEEASLSFTKKYDGRHDEITYQFRRESDNLWVGSYSGRLVGSGQARCVITEVPSSMFDFPTS